MRCFAALLALVCLAEARPGRMDLRASISFDPYILGGVEATPGEFPWQLSLERLGATWSHSCGASLLYTNFALTAGHCVDGADPATVRIIAGLHVRTDQTNAQISAVTSHKIHEAYGVGAWTFPNDIAVITLTDPFILSATVTRVVLPLDNADQFVGITCTLSGWGRTSASNILPDALQKVDIPVISNEECNTRMQPVSGAACDVTQIAVYDAAEAKGSCNGDSGGPMNCPSAGATVVAGVTSWGISGGGACMPSYPSVYTRTSSFLGWIDTNTGITP
jgi:elastase-2